MKSIYNLFHVYVGVRKGYIELFEEKNAPLVYSTMPVVRMNRGKIRFNIKQGLRHEINL
jgi:hypothetical protein